MITLMLHITAVCDVGKYSAPPLALDISGMFISELLQTQKIMVLPSHELQSIIIVRWHASLAPFTESHWLPNKQNYRVLILRNSPIGQKSGGYFA